MSDKLTEMARDILSVSCDLPARLDLKRDEHPKIDDFDVYVFEQTWGSTALGFPGWGGNAVTTASVCVLVPLYCHQKCFVYFGGRFAYAVEDCETFRTDLLHHSMVSVDRAKERYR